MSRVPVDMFRNNRLALLMFSALFLAAVLLLLYGTAQGIGVGPDSVVYLSAARNLLAGNGLLTEARGTAVPMTHFPPFYPFLLATLGGAGVEPLVAGRWLNVLLYGLNVGLVCFMIRRFGGGVGAAASGGLLALTSISLLVVHTELLTEPLFIALLLLTLLFTVEYASTARTGWLVACSVTVAISLLSRYAGAALLLFVALAILRNARGARGIRLKHLLLFGALSGAPLALWLLHNALTVGNATNRALAFHPPGIMQLRRLFATLAAWLLPLPLPEPIAVMLGIAVVAALLLLIRRAVREAHATWDLLPLKLLFLFLGVYLLFLLTSVTLFDSFTPFSLRILAPAYPVWLVLTLLLASLLQGALAPRARRVALLVGLLVVLPAYLVSSGVSVATFHREGRAYTTREYRSSSVLGRVNTLRPETPLYTNSPDIVYLHAGRASHMLPGRFDPHTLRPNPGYAQEMEEMARVLDSGGMLLYFSEVTWQSYQPGEGELQRLVPLRAVAADGVATLYAVDP